MRKENKLVELRCDFCGKIVDKFAEPRSLTLYFRPVEPAGIMVYGKGFGPGPGSEDICQECFDTAIKKIAKRLSEVQG